MDKVSSFKVELAELGSQLSTDPNAGTALGNNCFKIRLSIASKGKGKSGGARVITISTWLEILSFYFPFTINPTRIVSITARLKHFLNSLSKEDPTA